MRFLTKGNRCPCRRIARHNDAVERAFSGRIAVNFPARHGAAPGLMACRDHAADRELYRRTAVELPLMRPEAAIDESEADDALATAIVLRDSFADDPDVHALLSAVVDALAGTTARR